MRKLEDVLFKLFLVWGPFLITVACCLAFYRVLGEHVALLFLAFVVLTSLYGGYVTGFMAVLLAAFSCTYVFRTPKFSLAELIVFLVISIIVCWASCRARSLRRKAEAETKSREDMVNIISHELKNPLTAMTLGIQLILKEAANDEKERKIQEQAKRIYITSRRMEKLLDEILMIGKIQNGRFAPTMKKENLRAIMEDLSAIFAPLAAQKSLGFNIPLPDEKCDIVCDRDGIYHVLSNLLGNAIKFSERGTVSLSAQVEKKQIVFAVKDEGCGISPHEIPNVFEKYWQGNHCKEKGIGLGLFLAKGIIESHGGHIVVQSKVGHGTNIFFSLPLTKSQAPDGEFAGILAG